MEEKLGRPGSIISHLILDVMNLKCFSQPHSAILVQSRIRQGLVLFSLCCGCFLFEETRLEKAGQGMQAAEFRMNNKGCGGIRLLSDSENTEQINFRSC